MNLSEPQALELGLSFLLLELPHEGRWGGIYCTLMCMNQAPAKFKASLPGFRSQQQPDSISIILATGLQGRLPPRAGCGNCSAQTSSLQHSYTRYAQCSWPEDVCVQSCSRTWTSPRDTAWKMHSSSTLPNAVQLKEDQARVSPKWLS